MSMLYYVAQLTAQPWALAFERGRRLRLGGKRLNPQNADAFQLIDKTTATLLR
jgi:hypothetical protein